MTVDAKVLRVLTRLFSSAWFWAALAAIVLAIIFTYESFNPVPMQYVNAALWIVTNLILFATYVALTFYVLLYGLVFEWRWLPEPDPITGRRLPNIGGRRIFQLTASLAALVVLVVVQLFFFTTTGRPWYIPPVDPEIWLPTLRFLVYGAIAMAIFQLAGQLIRNIVNSEPVEVMVTPRAGRLAAVSEEPSKPE